MTTAAKFFDRAYKPDGDEYFCVPLPVLANLDSFERTAAIEVEAALWIFGRDGNAWPTSAEMASLLGRSISFVQKGLAILEKAGIIDRIRRHGRRFIEWCKGLRGGKAPPSTPPKKDIRDTTTREPSSSSLESTPEKTGEPDPAEVDALYQRARQVLDGVSRGDILAAIRRFSAEWVRKTLDFMAKRNAKPGNARKGWGYALGILLNREAKGDWPEDAPKAAPTPARKPAAEAEDPAEKAREKRLREAWGLLSEPEREEIRATVRAENPALIRFAPIFEAACMTELERRESADLPRAP
jgi:hypothetical protein